MPRKKKSIRTRIVSEIRKGSIHFSLGWPPVSYSYPLSKTEKAKPSSRRASKKGTVLIPEVLPRGYENRFALAKPNRGPQMNPIQRESLPMIADKISEAKNMGRNDLVLWWSMIEYAVRSPRKAKRTLEEILDSF